MSRRKMTPYEKGRILEYYCKKQLENKRANHVVRTARSHGLFDLIAIFPEKREIWLVQVKYSRKIETKEKIKKRHKSLSKLEGLFKVIPCVYTMTWVEGKGRYDFIKLKEEE